MNLSQTGFDLLSLLQPTNTAASGATTNGDQGFGELFGLTQAGLQTAAADDTALPLATDLAALTEDASALMPQATDDLDVAMSGDEMLGQIQAKGDLAQAPQVTIKPLASQANSSSLAEMDALAAVEADTTAGEALSAAGAETGDDTEQPLFGMANEAFAVSDEAVDQDEGDGLDEFGRQGVTRAKPDTDEDSTDANVAAVPLVATPQNPVVNESSNEEAVDLSLSANTGNQAQAANPAAMKSSIKDEALKDNPAKLAQAGDDIDESALDASGESADARVVDGDTLEQPLNTLQNKLPRNDSQLQQPAQNTASVAADTTEAAESEDSFATDLSESLENTELQDMLLNGERGLADGNLEFGSDRGQWGAALGSRIITMVANDIQEARIQLDPPELGAMEIQMEVTADDQARVQIQVQNPQVREVLESQAQRLREAMSEQGLTLAGFDVSEQGAGQQQMGQSGSGDGNAEGNANGQGANTADNLADGNLTEDGVEAQVTSASDRLVSTYA
ncbi:flagellar hook-length control protein FliK [Oceanobacter kriegii]|uniref:flagellar hook-length control protein FliK n=1 Tax=Oceanobacter kriegii TaxID=64972 RepID=UPI000418D03A|nr:flagellar hook-length control protein FliK [Oceanobacter kriegii]